MLNHQKLECYQRALKLVRDLASRMPNWPKAAALKDQTERAAMSVVLNIAEGAGKITPKDRRRFYAIARGSLQEVSACMDVAEALGLTSPSINATSQAEILIVVKQLSKLIASQS